MADNFLAIIGLEIHIELKTKSKMFCGCSADYLRVNTSKQGSSRSEDSYFAAKPNTHCCPTCLGLPGALPAANRKAIEWTVMAGLALGCQIPLFSKFDRKNYFYPDLPKGYQISQYDLPFAVKGRLKFEIRNSKLEIRIRRVHLEEDTAKMIHNKEATLLDFNRSGVPLMEIVTEPDIRSAFQAKEFTKKLQQIMRYLGISDCDMEKGSMRIEPNISILEMTKFQFSNSKQHQISNDKLPRYKVEIKNINSLRFMEKAIDYEINRQIQIIKDGKKPIQETRGYNEIKQITYTQRIKEEASDYRYFPEPDLPPIRWKKSDIEKFRNLLPELPEQKINRFIYQFNILKSQAEIISNTKEKADYFEETVKLGKKDQLTPTQIANVIINKKINEVKLLPVQLVKILVNQKSKTIKSGKILKKIVIEVIKENDKAVKDYQKGKISAIEFLVGQVIRKTKSQADANEVKSLLTRLIRN